MHAVVAISYPKIRDTIYQVIDFARYYNIIDLIIAKDISTFVSMDDP